MSIPLATSYGGYQDPSYATGEQLAWYIGRLQRPGSGQVPVLYFHDYLVDAAGTQHRNTLTQINAHAANSYPVIAPELGGTSQWATPDVVDPGGHVDDAIAYAATQPLIGTRTDKVAILALGMGTLNALNWAWRNPGKVRSMVLVGPIVDAAAYYNGNPDLQATINADWGSGAAWTAALPDIDPMQNLALIRPFGHRIQLWYGDADTRIDGATVQAFAELVGAEAVEFDGTSNDYVAARADLAAAFTLRQIAARQGAYIGWDERDLDRFDEVPLTLPAPGNVNQLRTVVAVGGRRAEFIRRTGSEGNERHAYLLREVSAADMRVKTTWHNGDGGLMTGQQGNIMRAVTDEDAGTYALYMCWSNILFSVPWIVNRAVWTGNIGSSLNLLGLENSTITGLRLSAGGQVLASERTDGIVTLICHQEDLDRSFRTGIIDVLLPGALDDFVGAGAVRVNGNRIQYAQAGPDVTSGGSGTWADFGSCFPYEAETELIGTGTATTMRGRFYRLGQDPPDWDDPDWTFTWTDTAAAGPGGYGKPGWLAAHVGIYALTTPDIRVQLGPFITDER